MPIERLQTLIIAITILILPLHTLVVVNIIDLPFLIYWKEFALALLLFLYFVKFTIDKKFDFIDLFIFLLLAYIFLMSLTVLSKSALYGLRNLSEPLLFLICAKNISLSNNMFRIIVKVLVIVACIVSLFGIFQCLFLGDQFLLDLGYSPGKNGKLHHSFYFAGGIIQRNVGTFASPNNLGFFLVLILVLLDNYNLNFHKKLVIFIKIVLYISLILSFSRSAILGLILYFMINNLRMGFKFMFYIILFFITLHIVLPDFFLPIKNFIELTLSGKDPSLKGHFDSLSHSFQLVRENLFFGIELGRIGPKATIFFNNLIDVESSFFCLILELGILGFILYLLPFLILMKNKVILFIFISIFPALFFLPMIYELEVIIVLFVIIGLISRKQNEKKITS